MPSRTDTRPAPSGGGPAPTRLRVRWWWVALAAAAVVAMATIGRMLATPSAVSKVTIQNPTSYTLYVDLSAGPRQGATAVAIVPRDSTVVAEDIVDPGPVWVFHFAAQGHDGGTVTVDRADLKKAGWRFVVPGSVDEHLHTAGALPNP